MYSHGDPITVYWALVKKKKPTVGKPIMKMGVAVTKSYKISVPSSCKTCRLLCSGTDVISQPRYAKGAFTAGWTAPPEQTIRYALMSGSLFSMDVKVL